MMVGKWGTIFHLFSKPCRLPFKPLIYSLFFLLLTGEGISLSMAQQANMVSGQAMQDVVITGTVTDESGAPIPGVTVSIPGTSTGTATDLDGKYSLSVPEGATLEIGRAHV